MVNICNLALTNFCKELLCDNVLGRDRQLIDQSIVHVVGVQGHVQLLEEWP